ncbi:MAG: thiamine pyrophosphate-binding protein, partial [Chromatiales bacterium]|nr:thiamine pyrophosphate-binding protein [Chromatiales bacterium]
MATTSTVTGAQAIAALLREAGINRVYALSGNQIMALFDAFIDADIDIIHVRHEAAAVHMADAAARLTGTPQVALVTAGPGHANAVSALFSALSSQSPVVMLSGHSPAKNPGLGHFQELDQATMARPVTKAAWTPSSADTLVETVGQALALSVSGTPGPVQVSLPVDLLEGEAAPCAIRWAPPSATEEDAVAEVKRLLTNAARPIIVAGPSACRGQYWQALTRLSARTGIAIVAAESPRGLKDPALGVYGQCLGQADVVILAAKEMDFTLGYGASPTIGETAVVVDIAPGERATKINEHASAGRIYQRLIGTPENLVEALDSGLPDA